MSFKVTPLKYNTHMQASFQASKHFWNSLFVITNSSCFDLSFMPWIVAKRFPFISVLSFGKRKKSAEAKSGEYGGWGMITVLFLVKSSRTSIDVWAGALSWCKFQLSVTPLYHLFVNHFYFCMSRCLFHLAVLLLFSFVCPSTFSIYLSRYFFDLLFPLLSSFVCTAVFLTCLAPYIFDLSRHFLIYLYSYFFHFSGTLLLWFVSPATLSVCLLRYFFDLSVPLLFWFVCPATVRFVCPTTFLICLSRYFFHLFVPLIF